MPPHVDQQCNTSATVWPLFAGETGDKLALSYLLSCLKYSHLSAVAFDAIYAIFMWHPNPEITALMHQACSMISSKEAAVPILDRIIELEPDYYEVRSWLFSFQKITRYSCVIPIMHVVGNLGALFSGHSMLRKDQ